MKKNTSLACLPAVLTPDDVFSGIVNSHHDRVRMRNAKAARAARAAYIRSIRRKVTAAVISAASVLTVAAVLVWTGIIRVF